MKVLKVLVSGAYKIKPKQNHYGCLEIDEFWTYAGKKQNKARLMYAYDRETGEIVVSNLRFAVWGKRDLKTAKKVEETAKTAGNKLLLWQRQTIGTVFFRLLRKRTTWPGKSTRQG
jgi:hypothetical protein